nr:FHA domain-containing protein [Ktedonobacterales bacterium]
RLRFTYTEATGLAVLEEQPTEKFALPGVALPDAKPHAQARLTVLTGPEAGRSWPVTGGVVNIGRGQNNLVSLPHPSVSRAHAQLVVQATGIYIQDIGSANGASVNGEALTSPHLLHDGDHIQIGDILLIINIEAATNTLKPEDAPTQRLPATQAGASATPPAYRGAMTRPGVGPRPSSSPDAAEAPSQFRPPQTTHPLPSSGDRSLPRFRPLVRPEDESPQGE